MSTSAGLDENRFTASKQNTSVTLTHLCLLAMLVTMREKMEKARKITRAPRIRVPNNERALFTVEAVKFVGTLQRLSHTGGSVILAKGPVPPGTQVQIDFTTVLGKVTAQIQFLKTGAERMPLAQGFRFLDMDERSSRRFTAAIEQMQGAGFSDVDEEEQSIGDVASRSLSKVWNAIHRLSVVISRS